ncbi:MAG: DUF4230 domain-containing protein [Clostridia bacterium]|nr:DUF4230 domain-containing protein [Clostridia bacterium]
MKRFVAILLLLSMVLSCLLLAGCEQKKSTLWDNDEERFDELRRVCNLTTVKFTIHKNVISSVVRSTFFDLFDLPVDWFDYQFTVEYDAQVEVGVKIQSIDVTPPATENGMYLVTVVLEKPSILSTSVVPESVNEESVVAYNANTHVVADGKVSLELLSEALRLAQEDLVQYVSEKELNFSTAVKNAKTMIEAFVAHIGEQNGRDYRVTYTYSES